MAVAGGRVHIPDGLTDSHAQEIEKFLTQVLAELQKVDANARRVTSRLNYSRTDQPVPAWGGTVEDQGIQGLRRFDPGRVRFGQSNRSAVYDEAIMHPTGDIIVRDWGVQLPEKSKPGYGPGQALGPKAGCRYQLYIAVRIKDDRGFHHVASLTAGFEQPPDIDAVRPVMERWARDGSPYVQYLRDNFHLGGPHC